jgi:hypothetical protein
LAWWNIALQQSQRTKNNKHQKKPRVISNYRWWKEEVNKTISSKWATFNKFGPNQFFKAMVWNGKKWSESDYDSRKKDLFFWSKSDKSVKKRKEEPYIVSKNRIKIENH